MSKYEIKLPQMGESVAEATLVSWLKEVGDYVELDEPIVEIATDKVDSEVPSEFEGYLIEKRFEVDDVIQVGEVIAIIDSRQAGSDPTIADSEPVTQAESEQPQPEEAVSAGEPSLELLQAERTAEQLEAEARKLREQIAPQYTAQASPGPAPAGEAPAVYSGRFYSPLVRNIAREEGIPQEELDRIPGTGSEGRLTKDDLFSYLQKAEGSDTPSPVLSAASAGQPPVVSADEPQARQEEPENEESTPKEARRPEVSSEGPGSVAVSTRSSEVRLAHGDEIIPLSRMGKLIAHHMKESVATSAHVQSFVEADVTRLVEWRRKVKKEFESREGEKLTFTPMFMEAVALALKKYPMLNISLEGDSIIRKKRINLGMAAALPDGNLIVPVIKDADQLNLIGMARQVNDLAHRSRHNQLKPDEVKDGTYTVTNVGSFGSVFGTPIINQPQVGILALGAIRKVPAVIETESGDFVGIRSKMFLSHSYDHRVVNGALGGMFVKAVADYLENWDIDRSI